MRITALALALLLGVSSFALAGSGKDSPNDKDNGGGNQPHAPGQTTNPNPGKMWEPPTFAPAEQHIIMANVPPGSGNWGGGPGNSGSGDKNGNNNQGGGGQTPPGQDK